MYSPIAGADVRPGDSIPTQSKNPSRLSFKIKSPPTSWALFPENDVITILTGTFLTVWLDFSITSSKCSLVERLSCLSSIKSDVGPTRVFSSIVGVTRIPLPFSVGRLNIT